MRAAGRSRHCYTFGVVLALRALALVVLSRLALGGCGDADPPRGVLELGTGEASFEPLLEGADLPLIRGSQGGYHVWLSFRLEQMAAGIVGLHIETQLLDASREPEHSRVRVPMGPADDEGVIVHPGWPAIVASPACLVDALVRLSVTIIDDTGREAFDERHVMVRTDTPVDDPCE
jgi:hypothetical protein